MIYYCSSDKIHCKFCKVYINSVLSAFQTMETFIVIIKGIWQRINSYFRNEFDIITKDVGLIFCFRLFAFIK